MAHLESRNNFKQKGKEDKTKFTNFRCMENLFYFNEHNSHYKSKSDYKSEFKYRIINEGDVAHDIDTSFNHLLFLKEGKIILHCNDFHNKELKSNECILLHKTAKVSLEVIESGHLLVFTFDIPRNSSDNLMLQSYKAAKCKIQYMFTPTPVREPLTFFVEVLAHYLNKGINNEYLHQIKESELFLLLRSCYTQDEIVSLFHPIIGISDFKNFVLKNYMKVKNVTELVELSGMGRTAFDYTFREIFGISARQWMLKQIAQHISYKAMDPEITIKGLMQEFKFNSATHFNRFCKQQFNCTPTELIQKSSRK